MSRRVIITDCATLRYLERVGGFEIDALRRQIADRLRPYTGAGASGVVIDGHTYVIDHRDEGSFLVTVLPKGRTRSALSCPRYPSRREGQ